MRLVVHGRQTTTSHVRCNRDQKTGPSCIIVTVAALAPLVRNLNEVQAESLALRCVESLGVDGAAYPQGYIQSNIWIRRACFVTL